MNDRPYTVASTDNNFITVQPGTNYMNPTIEYKQSRNVSFSGTYPSFEAFLAHITQQQAENPDLKLNYVSYNASMYRGQSPSGSFSLSDEVYINDFPR